MSTTPSQIVCPKCGTVNQSIARFCVSCGNPLVAPVPSSPVQTLPPLEAPAGGAPIPPTVIPSTIPPPVIQPPPMLPPQGWYPAPQQYYAYAAAFYEAQRREQVDRTGSGLLVIAIGFFLSWVPFVGAVGYLLEIIGAVLVIMGRRAFGPKQARNVFWSIIIFIIGIVATVVTAFTVLFAAIVTPNSTGSIFPVANYFLFVDLVWVGFIGFVELLLIYELELTTGRILLWFGLAGSLVTTTVNLLIVPNITSGLSGNIFAVLFLNGLVSLTPAIIKGVAYLLARERIVHGDIPTPQQLGR